MSNTTNQRLRDILAVIKPYINLPMSMVEEDVVICATVIGASRMIVDICKAEDSLFNAGRIGPYDTIIYVSKLMRQPSISAKDMLIYYLYMNVVYFHKVMSLQISL